MCDCHIWCQTFTVYIYLSLTMCDCHIWCQTFTVYISISYHVRLSYTVADIYSTFSSCWSHIPGDIFLHHIWNNIPNSSLHTLPREATYQWSTTNMISNWLVLTMYFHNYHLFKQTLLIDTITKWCQLLPLMVVAVPDIPSLGQE